MPSIDQRQLFESDPLEPSSWDELDYPNTGYLDTGFFTEAAFPSDPTIVGPESTDLVPEDNDADEDMQQSDLTINQESEQAVKSSPVIAVPPPAPHHESVDEPNITRVARDEHNTKPGREPTATQAVVHHYEVADGTVIESTNYAVVVRDIETGAAKSDQSQTDDPERAGQLRHDPLEGEYPTTINQSDAHAPAAPDAPLELATSGIGGGSRPPDRPDSDAVFPDIPKPREGDSEKPQPVEQQAAHIDQPDIDNRERRLFSPIEDARLVITPAVLLPAFGVRPELVEEIKEGAETLRRISALALNRRPMDPECRDFEGRGAYHTVPLGDRIVTLYVKGGGSDLVYPKLNTPAGPFPGFPSTPEGLLYQRITSRTSRPRITGTLTASWALMELANASDIFAQEAEQHDWRHRDEALEAGTTIPQDMLALPSLSAYLGNLTRQYIAGASDMERAAILGWPANNHLVVMSLLVPGNERIRGGIEPKERGRLHTVANGRGVGQTLRRLAKMGYCYSVGSAHAQNIYNLRSSRPLAHADSSDLVTLADYDDQRITITTGDGLILAETVPAGDRRTALMFLQLNGTEMVPPVVALPHERYAPWDDKVIKPQLAFWNKLLQGLADSRAIARIPNLMPLMGTEINMAAASLLIDPVDWASAERRAAQKRAFLSTYEEPYGALSEYERKVADNLLSEESIAFSRMLRHPALDIPPLIDFMKTGDIQRLWNSPHFSRILRLQRAIDGVTDNDFRQEMIRQAQGPAFTPTLHSNAEDILASQQLSLITEFDGRHYDLIRHYIETDNPGHACSTMISLNMAASPYVMHEPALGGEGERLDHHYARRLLVEGMTDQLYAQLQFEVMLGRHCFEADMEQQLALEEEQASNGGTLKEAAMRLLASESYNVLAYTIANDLPPVTTVVRAILGQYLNERNDEINHRQISHWLDDYAKAFQRYNESRNSQTPDQPERANKLVEAALVLEESGIPELELAHCAWLAFTASGSSSPQVAPDYYDAVRDYYERVLPSRRYTGIGDPYLLASDDTSLPNGWLRRLNQAGTLEAIPPEQQTRAGAYDRIAKKYEALDLRRIAWRYRELPAIDRPEI